MRIVNTILQWILLIFVAVVLIWGAVLGIRWITPRLAIWTQNAWEATAPVYATSSPTSTPVVIAASTTDGTTAAAISDFDQRLARIEAAVVAGSTGQSTETGRGEGITRISPTPIPTTAPVPTATAEVVVNNTIPTDVNSMPSWLGNHFGGETRQWHRLIDQATGRPLDAWEFTSANRELGVGDNAILGYGSESNAGQTIGKVSYGVRNSTATQWDAAYLCGPGDFTIAQVGMLEPVAIDTATWKPGTCSADEMAARTPSQNAPATDQLQTSPGFESSNIVTAAWLESQTGGPAQYWSQQVGEDGSTYWKFNSKAAGLTYDLTWPGTGRLTYGVPDGNGSWKPAELNGSGLTGQLDDASFLP